jgi:hypothetical protein
LDFKAESGENRTPPFIFRFVLVVALPAKKEEPIEVARGVFFNWKAAFAARASGFFLTHF